MSAFNRNIITNADIERLLSATSPQEVPRTLGAAPPAGAVPVASPTPGAVSTEPATATQATSTDSTPAVAPSGDDYSTKLLKYVPPELIGAYVFLSATIGTNAAAKDRPWWLEESPVGHARADRGVRPPGAQHRPAGQVAISVLGLGIYVFATGGWFATTTWYQPWYGSIALVLFGLLVAVIRLKPLPTEG